MNNPFDVIPRSPSQQVKVWDIIVPSKYMVLNPGLRHVGEDFTQAFGRVKVLAVVPRKPNLLENIPVSLAFCSPHDINQYSKKKANQILIGRWLKAFEFCQTADYSDARPVDNTGIVKGPLLGLDGFAEEAMLSTQIPMWVDMSQFYIRFNNDY